MATRITAIRKKSQKKALEQPRPKAKSLEIFDKGILNSRDFARGMSALMSDLITNAVTPQIGNAVVNAGGKLLKIVELEHKYGIQRGGSKVLQLADQN